MQDTIDKRKQQEWLLIEQQYKNYKRNFQARPLIPKQVSTYLEITNFITQLVPAFSQQYFKILTEEENAFANQVTQNICNDMQAKIKSLAYRIQKKEIQENNNKDVKTLCKACLHELRSAEIAEARQALESKEFLTQNIMKIIREVEETSQPFSLEEDRRFFKELKAALKKKEEVLQLCQIEGNEFICMIEDQLKGILIDKELLLFQENRYCDQSDMKGYELKESVTKSLKTHINEKIPEIIKLVTANIRKTQERNKKLKAMNAEVQTGDWETSKIIELRRRVTTLQADIVNINNQKTQLSWTIQQKTLTIQKMQKQLKILKQQYDAKAFEHQKETKNLQQKNRKLKEQLERQKSRRVIDSTEHNLNSFAQLKEPSLAGEAPNDEPEPDLSRKEKRKKTITNLTRTNGKFYLPTLKKISNEDDSVLQDETKKQQSLADKYLAADYNQPSNDNTIISQMQSPIQAASKPTITSKQRNRSRKKGERMMTISNSRNETEVKHKKQVSYKTIKTQREAESMEHIPDSPQKSTIPLAKAGKEKIASLQKKNKNDIKRVNHQQKLRKDKIVRNHLQNDKTQQQKLKQLKQMRSEAQEVNQRLKERSSVHSSSVSHKNKAKSINQTGRQSIYKPQPKTQQPVIPQPAPAQQKQAALKHYLRNSFSKINEEIDKQSYQTPLNESQGVQGLKKLQNNKSIKHHLLQIYRELSKESKEVRDISIDRFSQIFQKYVNELDQNSNSKNEAETDEAIVTAITEPTLPRIKQAINRSTLNLKEIKQNDQYCGINQVKKVNQKSEMEMLKSRLSGQVSAIKSKENSLNASYHVSPRINEEQFQLSRINKRHKVSTLLTLQKMLFFNEQLAYRYQTTLSKKKDKLTAPLLPHMQDYINSLFQIFQVVKRKNPPYYQQISGFLRYPFSHSRNGFLQIDIIKSLSLSSLAQCFMHLLAYHQKCEKEGTAICSHLTTFKKRVEQYGEAGRF